MFFRRIQQPTTQTPHGTVYGTLPQCVEPPRIEPPRIECIGLTLAEMATLERILLHAEDCTRRARPDLGYSSRSTDLIGRLYRSAGAASVTQPDPDLVRIPVELGDFTSLEYAIRDIERYQGDAQTARDARQLLNRCNALLGQLRAVIHAGTSMFDPDAPVPVSVDVPELPAH
ncbi:hypothetical protein OHA38_43780 (plasmid) [Streptomyces sp. NBC_01732]|uniref:hypothetical protein n=1 Tax=Streptomyces sp. NBC_01732 TaxID=2975926 RepID=UPI00352E1BA3|nr:hypothetical protein OHA38_43780 [Streptomyces sp. NBC_01732]